MTRRPLALHPGLLVAVFLCLRPLHSSAQSTVNTIQLSAGLSMEAEYQAMAPSRNWATPIQVAVRQWSDADAARSDGLLNANGDGWLRRAAGREVASMSLSGTLSDSALLRVQQTGRQKRSWIGRHPVLFGALVGFGAGYVIGYLPGDDGVFYDFTAEFNGLVLGGVGAGVGALVGVVATK